MSKQSPYYGQPEAASRANGCEGMAKIVDARALQASGGYDRGPRLFEVRARRAFLLAGNDKRIAFEARQVGEHFKGCGGKKERLPSCLRLGQENYPALKVDLLPLRMKDFPQACTAQDQQPDRCDREWVEACDAGSRASERVSP